MPLDDNILISVILPVYNVEEWVEESVRSVCKQDFPHVKYEIIVVNDGSTDGSAEIAEAVLAAHDIKYTVISQENAGVSAARNRGIDSSIGRYITFIDSDDVILPSHLSKLFSAIEGSDAPIAYTDFQYTIESNRYGSTEVAEGKTSIIPRNDMLKKFMLKRISICCMLFKREFIISRGLYFDTSIKFIEDGEFQWRAFTAADRAAHTDGQSYKYLIHKNSTMTAQKIERNIDANRHIEQSFRALQAVNTEFDYDMAYARHIFGCMHSFARVSGYTDFITYRDALYTPDIRRKLKRFPDYRVRILNICIKFFPKIFHKLFNKSQQ